MPRQKSNVRKITTFYSPDAKRILEGELPERVPGIVQLHAFIAVLSMRCACNQPFLHEDHPALLLLPAFPRKYMLPGHSESGHLDYAIQQATRVEIHVKSGHTQGRLLVEVEFFRMAREQIYAITLDVDPAIEMRVSLQQISPHPV